jgi:hypothetical protein
MLRVVRPYPPNPVISAIKVYIKETFDQMNAVLFPYKILGVLVPGKIFFEQYIKGVSIKRAIQGGIKATS